MFISDAQSSHTMDNILDYFPGAEGDGLNIVWAHAVNSQAELDEALTDDTMMLEADVSAENNTGIPIMAHPPDVYSDLTLEEWLVQCTETDKGMKMDFKDINVVTDSMDIINFYEDRIHQPLWLNADIVKGPNGGDPVPPVEFISKINDGFPTAVLSLGWTTSWIPFKSDMYTWTMIFDNMFYSYPSKQPVTFPVRAVWSITSWNKFVWILGVRHDFSITVWTGSNDNVDVQGLVELRKHGDIKRIYYDLTDELMQEFEDALALLTTPVPTTSDGTSDQWDSTLWNVIESQAIGDYVYLSTDSVGLVGVDRGAFIESKYEYQAGTESLEALEITGTIQFVFRVDEDTYAAGDGVEIYIRSSGISNLKMIEDGLRLYIGRDGEVRLESVTSPVEGVSDALSPSDCYSFKVVDKGSISAVLADVQPVECTDGTGNLPTEVDPVSLSLAAPYDENERFFIVMSKAGDDIDVLLEDVILPHSDGTMTSHHIHQSAMFISIFISILQLV
ncbi:protein FAM151A-like [Saccoglossus kowalevskii]